jgi:hypothetical protein
MGDELIGFYASQIAREAAKPPTERKDLYEMALDALVAIARPAVAAERERARLHDACKEALVICEGRQEGTYDDIMRIMRAALRAAEGE